MNHRTIAESFQEYLRTVFTGSDAPPEPGSVQYIEMRRCFFAAFYDGFFQMLKAANEGTQAATVSANRWAVEGKEFGQLVKEGKA